MSDDRERELIAAQREINQKLAYFLLTAAGAGIALAVNQTQGAQLQLSQIPLGLAVLSWGGSVLAGCQRVRHHAAAVGSNALLLRKARDGRRGEESGLGEMVQQYTQQLETASSCAWWQFLLLILGGVFFVVWHVLEMYLRTQAHI